STGPTRPAGRRSSPGWSGDWRSARPGGLVPRRGWPWPGRSPLARALRQRAEEHTSEIHSHLTMLGRLLSQQNKHQNIKKPHPRVARASDLRIASSRTTPRQSPRPLFPRTPLVLSLYGTYAAGRPRGFPRLARRLAEPPAERASPAARRDLARPPPPRPGAPP